MVWLLFQNVIGKMKNLSFFYIIALSENYALKQNDWMLPSDFSTFLLCKLKQDI